MNAGELRHRVTIERAASTLNAAGESIAAWATLATVYAAIRPASSREMMLTQGVQSQATHTVTIRYIEGLRDSDRIRFNGRTLDIAGIVNVDERNVELRLLAYETN